MRKMIIALLAAFLVGAITASGAMASSVHLKGGKNAEPKFTDGGLTLNAAGELSGLGNGDVLVTMTATANATADCVNPGSGEHRPPGQNPAPVTVSGSQAIPQSEIKNGNTPFSVTTNRPVTPIPGAPGCPNTQWTENITDLQFTSAVITVEQPPGTLVLTVSCTLSPATSNGPVPGGSVSCTSS
jgi:membrane-associated protease RseP (regulator of RpoE activity)